MTDKLKELLEALKALVEEATSVWEYGEDYPQIEIAIAAIAKAEQAERVDEYQAFIDTLPRGHDDKMYMQIDHWARQSYVRHKSSVRGQQITAADSMETHIIWATLRWAEENAVSAQLKAERVEPVAWGAFYFGGKNNGDLYAQCKTKAEIDAYIGQIHQSNDSITLRSAPLYTTPPAAAVSEPWQPIETAPEDGTEILMTNGVDVSSGQWFSEYGGTFDQDGAPNGDEIDAGWMDWSGGMQPEPTHWMPLPPAPSGVNE